MEPAPLEQFVPDLPAGLSQVIKRMMHKSPDERFATPLQVAEALEPFGDEYGKAESRSDAQLLTSAATSESARHIEAKAELLEIAAQSDAANLTAAQATGFGLKSPSDPAFEHDASRESKIASTVRSPDSGQGSDPEFPVNLILSPEPSLTEGLSRPKSRTLTSNSGTSFEGTVLARLPRFSLWGLSALTFTVMLIVVTLAVVNPFGETKGSLKKAPVPPVNKDAESLRKSTETSDNAANKSIPPSDIIVRIEGESDQAFTSDKFVDAIRVAMGSRGRVELRNSKPLRLSSANLKPLGFGTASGGLIISAAQGFEPVIEFELNTSKPLLASGSGVSVLLSGLTIVVHYSGPAAVPPPPLISVYGKSRIERCAFKVASGSYPKGSCAYSQVWAHLRSSAAGSKGLITPSK